MLFNEFNFSLSLALTHHTSRLINCIQIPNDFLIDNLLHNICHASHWNCHQHPYPYHFLTVIFLFFHYQWFDSTDTSRLTNQPYPNPQWFPDWQSLEQHLQCITSELSPPSLSFSDCHLLHQLFLCKRITIKRMIVSSWLTRSKL